jgi:putative endopeptidase
MKSWCFLASGLLLTMSCVLAAPPAREPAPQISRFSVGNMDRKVSPGTDFYRYANGAWLQKTSIPDDQVTWSPTTELTERNLALLKDLLEKVAADRPDRTAGERQVGDCYAAAMDEKRIEELAAQPIASALEKIAALASKTNLGKLVADLHERGVGGLFSDSVGPDEKQSDVYAYTLAQGGLGLPDRDYYLDAQFAKERVAYRAHLLRIHALLGTAPAEAERQAKSVLAIETALAKGSRKLEETTDPLANYHRVTLEELRALTPSFDWDAYLAGSHAAKLESVVVGQPEFFQALEKALGAFAVQDWQAYLRWHLLIEASPLLHEAMAQESFAFYGTELNGQPKLDARWKRSIRRVDSALGESLGQLYAARHFPPGTAEKAAEMVKNVEAVFRDRLAKVPWMTEATRQEATKKFSRFTAKIGAPARPRDYSGIEIRRDDFYGNVERASIWESRREMARIGRPVDRTEWGMTAPTVNAYFNPTMNEIVFPAGILQPPFFDPEMDDAVNYGATAATIGHEMTHGYDNDGRKYDAEGNLRDWWTKKDIAEFEARTTKLITQYNAYSPVKGLHVNGKLTLAENIADLGGLSIAYEALQRALGKDPEKRKLIDGLTPEQRFFISYAQSWASKARPAYLRQALTTDVHAPDAIRGYAPLLNLQEFYDSFGIKKGAPLWRAKELRAVIW